jgi:hypothetical protein
MRNAVPMTILLAVALAGCNASAPAPQAAAPVGPVARADVGPALPAGAPCSAAVSSWRELQRSDLETGNLGKSVYEQIRRETDAAATACAAGRDAEARSLVAASRQRHGYRS